MLVSNCLRASRRTKNINYRDIKTLVPQAYALIQDSVHTLTNTAGHKVFGPKAEEIVRDVHLEDKNCLITGANSGLGLEMTRCLNARDCHVLMACRNAYSANVASKKVCKNLDRVTIGEVDLASLRSVKNFTDQLLAEDKYVSWPLENRLLPTEEMLSLPADKYTSIKAFNVSKLCAIFGMHYLGYRWMTTKRGVFSATPGSFVKTKLCTNWWLYEMLYMTMQPFNKSIPHAAATPLYCATSPELDGKSAMHFKNCKRCEESELAMDSHLSFRLFDMTQRMLDERVRHFERPRLAAKDTPKPQDTEKLSKEAMEDDLLSSYSG